MEKEDIARYAELHAAIESVLRRLTSMYVGIQQIEGCHRVEVDVLKKMTTLYNFQGKKISELWFHDQEIREGKLISEE